MGAEKRTRRPHAAAFRGALLITLAALVTTMLALTLQYVQTVRYLEAEQRSQVDAEAASLLRRYEASGLAGVADFLLDQQQRRTVPDYFYLLATPDGRPIAGNLLEWPEAISGPGQYGFSIDVVSSQGRAGRWAEVRALHLGPGYRLLVGRLADTRLAARERYLASLIWSVLATAVVGLGLGWWLSRRALRFVDHVSDAGERLLAGNLGERLPVSPRRDEYDRLAEIINACFADLERTVQSLRTATDTMAHDLKTPLTRIKARLELARWQRPGSADLHQVIEATEADLNALLRSINDVLEIARYEGTSSASFVSVDLASLAAEAIELYRPLAIDKQIELRAELAAAPVRGAPALLSRAIANLVDNAVKHTPAGGIIEVTTSTAAGRARLTVRDTGPGMSREAIGRLEEARIELVPPEGRSGSGLGLSLVRTIVRVHRGTLEFTQSDPGLRVTLTLRSAAPGEDAPGRSVDR